MLALTSESEVYSWGFGEGGQLGHGNEAGLDKPQVISAFRNIEIANIAAGELISGAVDNHGQLWLWGAGIYGRLGLGNEENVNVPKMNTDQDLQNEKIVTVALGFYHTICASGSYSKFNFKNSE